MTGDTGNETNTTPTRSGDLREQGQQNPIRLRGNAAEREVAERVATQLHEPHAIQIVRLVQIFGQARVEENATEAERLYAAAQTQGAETYTESHDGSLVATKAGVPRSLGGVFFALMRRHAESLGINWFGLFPQAPWPAKNQSRAATGSPDAQPGTNGNAPRSVAAPEKVALPAREVKPAVSTPPPPKPQTVTPPVSVPSPKPPTNDTSTTIKPSRLKTTVVGSLSAAPKFDAASGLVELPFTVEMSPTLPKGLPNLGTSRVVVICTRKQFDKVAAAQAITPQTRFIIEGEATPAISRDLQPFLKVVVLRITTPELDQATRAKPGAAQT